MPRVVALVATYNERRFVAGLIEHFSRHGVDVYLIDNESTDGTVDIAARYDGHGLIGCETLPRHGEFDLTAQLRRKQEIAADLDADWIIHTDADERRLPPKGFDRLADALAAAVEAGWNAVNFLEYAFVPTLEQPDHDRPDFERTMRSYYLHLPVHPHRINAWQQTGRPVDLVSSGGHLAQFPSRRLAPVDFPMRHYLFLSAAHAVEKYVERRYSAAELARGWHQPRAELLASEIRLPSARELTAYVDDDSLNPSRPRDHHPLFDQTIERLFGAPR